MPFGLKTAVSVYSRFVAMAMAGVAPDKIGIYLDDMLIFTDDPYEHLKVLEEVFQKHREVGLKLKPSKTFLFQQEVEYLGHQLSAKGIAMIPSYQDKITSWPSPKSKQDLIHLLGVFGYYRAFIPNFAKTTQGFTSLRKLGAEFKWTEELEKDFIQLKKDFKSNNTISFPIYKSKEPFMLTIDFSVLAIGVTLSQKQDDKEQLIAAAGRRTTPGERNYASWKGEYAALVYGIRKYEHIL